MTDVNYKWFRWTSLFGILSLFLFCDVAQAQIVNNPAGSILDQFEAIQSGMRASFRTWTERLFWGLITIEFVISASIFAFQSGGGDISAFAAMLVPRLLIIGIFVFIFRYGYLIADVIVASFMRAGDMAAGVRLSPDAVYEHGLTLAREIIDNAGLFEKVVVAILSLVIVAMFALIASNVMIAVAELYIVLTAGVMLLGFLGSSWTREYAMGYFRFAIASGVKLLAMQILVGIGFQALQNFFPVGADIEFDNILAMVGMLFLIYLLSARLPDSAAGMVGGHANGGMGFMSQGAAALTSINANTRITAAALSKASSGAAKAGYNVGSSAKSAGMIGGGVGGAAATIGKAVSSDVKTSVASIAKGNGGQVGTMGSRVADNLRSQR